MDFGLSAEEQSFREEVSSWMHEHLTGEFAQLAGRGGPGDEHSFIAERPGHALELLAKVIAPARVARRSATELPGSLARPGRPQGCPRWGNWRILGLMIQFS